MNKRKGSFLLSVMLPIINLCYCSNIFTHLLKNDTFWHITDIHVDQNYSITGNPYELCHETNSRNSSINWENGIYGNFLCDAPWYLVNISIKAMRSINPQPRFIIWTGDNLPHTIGMNPDWNTTFEGIKNITNMLKKTFPQISIYPSIGNHDTVPPNKIDTFITIYEGYLQQGEWNKLLPIDTWSSFLNGGYYTVLLQKNLRLISLNTILWYSPNDYTAFVEDPAFQFKWLNDVLKNSSKFNEKVYIIGHVAPGFYNRVQPGLKSVPTYHPHHLEKYLHILKLYSKIIIGQFFGHLHMDMFQIFDINTGSHFASSLLASSVTPWHFIDKWNTSLPVNPSIRVIYFDGFDGSLIDYRQYFLNLSKANKLEITQNKVNNAGYELLYTFRNVYQVPDLSTHSLVKVYEKIKKDPFMFDIFYKYLTAGKESVACDSNCRTAQLCSIACTSIEEYNICMGNNLKKTFYEMLSLPEPHIGFWILILMSIISIICALFLLWQFVEKRFCYKKLHY